jgi:hypothetical protein
MVDNPAVPFSVKQFVPFSLSGWYRVQSRKAPEQGSLDGDLIISDDRLLSSETVNGYLKAHPFWNGRSTVRLKPAIVVRRTGVFADNLDALYYRDNFEQLACSPLIDHDLLDVTKLKALYESRSPLLRNIFTLETFDWLTSLLHVIEPHAINEYMCHEGGHRLGYSVDEKLASGFFRWGGKLRWPLIYLEEYRADINSWDIALRNRPVGETLMIVLYTIMHRFGLAAQNLTLGQPGAGYVPFLHFADLVTNGFLRLAKTDAKQRIDVQPCDAEILLAPVRRIIDRLSSDINEKEVTHNSNDTSAEAMLEYAQRRLTDRQLLQTFLKVFQDRPQ